MLQLKIERQFNAVPEKVFDAFTHPDEMRVWWTDETKFNIDLRKGGRWTITRKEGNTTYVMTGKYLEILKPFRLKYTIAMPHFSPNYDTISIEIKPDGRNGSIMKFVQEGKDIDSELKELPKGAISESEKGWQQGFDLMEKAWNK